MLYFTDIYNTNTDFTAVLGVLGKNAASSGVENVENTSAFGKVNNCQITDSPAVILLKAF